MRLRFTFATLLSATLLLAGLLTASVVSVSADSGSTLTGSPFNGHDGTLDTTPTPFPPAINDLPSGSATDDSFAQGAKEDDFQNVQLGFGGIPPNKNDLTKFNVDGGTGTVGGATHTFLYLGWTRASNNGDANIDFEFNKAQFGVASPGTVTLGRTAGDLLFLYDFAQGGGSPTIRVFEWVTTGPKSLCAAGGSQQTPCWKADATPTFEASISSNGLFGEAVIDLDASQLVPPGACEAFQQAWSKARSSTSLTATMKDYIAPGPSNINTCGATAVKKVDSQTGAALAGATFTLKDSGGAQVGSGTTGADGTFCVGSLNQGTYTWTETAAPPGYVILDQPQTVTINAVSSCPTTPFVITFHDQAKGALAVKKVSDKGSVALAGATFTLKDSGGTQVGSGTTDANGIFCVGNLVQGSYTWTETAAPGGFAIDTASQGAVLSAGSTCANTTNITTFSDAPLTDITATAKSEATVGGTQTTITCKDSGGNNVGNSPQGPAGQDAVTANGLKPGTYTCVLVVDP